MSEHITPDEAGRRLDELTPAFEIGHRYARVERATLMPDKKPETDGEHALSLTMIGLAYASKYHPELDLPTLALYFALHDIDEWLHGDVSSLGISPEAYDDKEAKEAEAAAEREARLAHFPELMALLRTLSDLSVPEFAFAKAFDKLAPSFTHMENNGEVARQRYGYTSYEDLLEGNRTVLEKMQHYAADFPDVIAMKKATIRRVAEVAFTDLNIDRPEA